MGYEIVDSTCVLHHAMFIHSFLLLSFDLICLLSQKEKVNQTDCKKKCRIRITYCNKLQPLVSVSNWMTSSNNWYFAKNTKQIDTEWQYLPCSNVILNRRLGQFPNVRPKSKGISECVCYAKCQHSNRMLFFRYSTIMMLPTQSQNDSSIPHNLQSRQK